MKKFQAINIFKCNHCMMFKFGLQSNNQGIDIAIGRNAIGNQIILDTYMHYPYVIQDSWWLRLDQASSPQAVIYAPRMNTTQEQRVQAVNWLQRGTFTHKPNLIVAKLQDLHRGKSSVVVDNFRLITEKDWYRILQ